MPLGIDATIRYAEDNWTEPLLQSELDAARPVQHAPEPRPAADADRQPGPRVACEAAAKPGEGRLPLLRRQAGRRAARHDFSATDAEFQRGRRRATTPRASAPAASRPTDLLTVRLGVCGWPVGALALAGDAQRRAGRARPDATGATRSCRSRPSVFAETVRALRGAGLRGRQRDDPAQGGGARARRHRDGDRARGRGRQHADLRATGAIEADNTDVGGLLDAIGRRATRRAHGAGAGRRRGRRGPPCTRWCRRARPTCRSGTAPRTRRAAVPRSSAAAPSRRPSRPTSSSSAPPSGLQDRRRPVQARFRWTPIRSEPESAWSTWSIRADGTAFLAAARSRGADVVDGLEVLVGQGAVALERWTGRPAPRDVMRRAVTAPRPTA